MNRSIHFISICILFFLSTFLYANPFIAPSTQDKNTEDTNNSTHIEQSSQQNKAQVSSVRISAANEGNLQTQRTLRETLGKAFYTWKELNTSDKPEDKNKAGAVLFTILSVAFLFGIVHALGPGHRKTIIFSLYLSRKAPVWEPFAVGLALSALHAGSAIVIIVILQGLSGSISAKADVIARWMEGISYIILIITALALSAYSIFEFIRSVKKDKNEESNSRKQLSLAAFIFSGIYPCPGAVLVLVLSFTLQMIPLGILSVAVMSVGMSIPIIASAYLAWAGRAGLFHFFKQKEKSLGLISFIAEITGYTLLLILSLYIAWPFLINLL